MHLVTDGRGLPLALHLTGGQRQECEVLQPVLNAVRIRLRALGRASARTPSPATRPTVFPGCGAGCALGTCGR
ncbi:MAG TPA: hypothetical protein VFW66_10550 [Gemmatimonadales bacterium]|nr:hypothetical protein [Gemmatimonadales bacterium]